MSKPDPHVVKPAGKSTFQMVRSLEMHCNRGEREFNRLLGNDRRDREKPNSKNGDKRP